MKELTPEEMKLISGGVMARQQNPFQQFIRLIEDFLSLLDGGNSKIAAR
jgi:hypothetical protein